MTVAPQGTLIQIFVELSKWGIGELPSWSDSRQVACRWLAMGRQHSGIRDASQKRLQVLDGALGVLRVKVRVRWKRKILGEGGTMVWLQLPEKGRWAPACNWWLLRWGSSVCPFANCSEQCEVLGAPAHHLWLGSASSPGEGLRQ